MLCDQCLTDITKEVAIFQKKKAIGYSAHDALDSTQLTRNCCRINVFTYVPTAKTVSKYPPQYKVDEMCAGELQELVKTFDLDGKVPSAPWRRREGEFAFPAFLPNRGALLAQGHFLLEVLNSKTKRENAVVQCIGDFPHISSLDDFFESVTFTPELEVETPSVILVNLPTLAMSVDILEKLAPVNTPVAVMFDMQTSSVDVTFFSGAVFTFVPWSNPRGRTCMLTVRRKSGLVKADRSYSAEIISRHIHKHNVCRREHFFEKQMPDISGVRGGEYDYDTAIEYDTLRKLLRLKAYENPVSHEDVVFAMNTLHEVDDRIEPLYNPKGWRGHNIRTPIKDKIGEIAQQYGV